MMSRTSLKVAFRTDASIQIGIGHVMRCLSLADKLAARGAECQFICRAHPGNLIDLIRSKGHSAHALPTQPAPDEATLPAADALDGAVTLTHSQWLGATQAQDARDCMPILADLQPDWLIADHYALDIRWELAVKTHYRKLFVIDDLADRAHACHLLLDQTLGRQVGEYFSLVPAECLLLCGPQYSLLRPEFASLRAYSLQRRVEPRLRHLLITMGGVDKDNATSQVLEALRHTPLPQDCRITVVMGVTAPWLAEVKQLARDLPWPATVIVGVSDMAQLMAESDLAIGAAGSTSWERCCLGLPAVMLVLASNQRMVASGLEQAGAARVLHSVEQVAEELPMHLQDLMMSPASLAIMSRSAAAVVDGSGLTAVIQHLEQ